MTATTNEPTISGERRIKMSYEDYLAWPEQGIQAEWVDGEMVIFMPPKDLHQATVGFIYRLIAQFVDLLKLGVVRVAPLEMRVRPDAPAREPDVLFISNQHNERLTAERLDGPADLAIEVISRTRAFRVIAAISSMSIRKAAFVSIGSLIHALAKSASIVTG